MQLYMVVKQLRNSFLYTTILFISGCTNIEPVKDNRDSYKDIELTDSLQLSNGRKLYSYRYSHFRSLSDEIYYSIANKACYIDSTNAVLMTPSVSFMNGIENDSINIILVGRTFEKKSNSIEVKFRFLDYEYGATYKNHRSLAIMKSELCK